MRWARGAALAACLLPATAPSGVAQTGEELYADVFGCWNCHGRRGEGGEGRPLRDTAVPLSYFLKELRLPRTTMPPFSPILATDAELALVYEWLGGVDPVAVPPRLALELEAPDDPRAGASFAIDVHMESTGDGLDEDGLEFRARLTLFRQDASLVADQPLEWQTEGGGTSTLSTDAYGEARLGPEPGWTVAALDEGVDAARLRATLPAGEYVLVIEAIRVVSGGEPEVLGVATAVLEIE